MIRALRGARSYRGRIDTAFASDYPVIYAIDDERRIVEVVKIGRRQEVYRD